MPPPPPAAFNTHLDGLRCSYVQLKAEKDNLAEENRALRCKLSVTNSPPRARSPQAWLSAPQPTILIKEDLELALTDIDPASSDTEALKRMKWSADNISDADLPGRISVLSVTAGDYMLEEDTSPNSVTQHPPRKAASQSSSLSKLIEEETPPAPFKKYTQCETNDMLGVARIGMLSDSIQFANEKIGRVTTMLDKKLHPGFRRSFLVTRTSEALIKRIHDGVLFRFLCIFAIVVNTFFVGAQANYETIRTFSMIDGRVLSEEDGYQSIEYGFTCWFTLEVIVRLAAQRRQFAVGEERWWNFIDVFLVLNSYFSLTVGASPNFAFVRILRVFRLVRAIKIIKNVKALARLRTMTYAIINSFVNLMWAILLIFLVIFLFGVIFQNAVTTYFASFQNGVVKTQDERDHLIELEGEFGNLYKTMGALFAAISGGNDWMMYANLLRNGDAGELYFLVFIFYIAFAFVGLLNVVTGIFVDSAVCTRTEDEIIDSWKDDLRRTAATLQAVFRGADTEQLGYITIEQFQNQLEVPWVKAYFHGLEIDPSDALCIFMLIDRDGNHHVDVDEFVSGTMRLKGAAKEIDVLTMMHDNAQQMIKFSHFCSFVEDELASIKVGLAGLHAARPPSPTDSLVSA